MSATKIYDLAVKVSTYTDRSGNEKGRWQNIGSVLQLENGGKVILLDRTFNPAGVANPDDKDSVMVSMFPPKEREQGGAAAEIPKPTGKRDTQWGGSQVDDRDVPF
jgi:hypothetical protein